MRVGTGLRGLDDGGVTTRGRGLTSPDAVGESILSGGSPNIQPIESQMDDHSSCGIARAVHEDNNPGLGCRVSAIG